MDNSTWLDLVDEFNAAPFQPDGWQTALGNLANATQSRAAQLIGFSEGTEPFFNCVANLEPDWVTDFLAVGGGVPTFNPRLEAGLAVPILETLTDESIVSGKERGRHAFYSDILPHSRTAHFCGTTLIRDEEMMVGLALLRQAREGEISEPQHQIFRSLAPHVRTAFRTQMLLKEHGIALLTGSLSALNLTVFICDRSGKVQAMTPSAEALVSGPGPLQLQGGLLTARYSYSQVELARRIRAVANGTATRTQTTGESLLVRQQNGLPVALDIVQIPALECPLNFQPRALVLVRDRKPDPAVARSLLMAAYSLTDAEAGVAILLTQGLGTEAISASRQVSVGTVRMQLKSLFAKVGVHSQVELLARLRPLL